MANGLKTTLLRNSITRIDFYSFYIPIPINYLYGMDKKKKAFSFKEKSIAFGLVAGVVVGVITNNIGVWLPVGIAIGAGVGLSSNKKENNG
jgi:hypothetical protein